MDFLWTDGATPMPGKPLREAVHTEVCVIGGGMAGVLCAAQLTAQGIDNVLLEARQIGEGITKGTTAVLTAQHDTLYRDITNLYGMERAQQYLRANLDALAQFRALAQHIDCVLETRPSVMYSLTGQDHLQEEAELLHALGFETAALALRDDSLSIADPRLGRVEKLALCLGTEGDGLANDTIADCDYTVRIPMSHGVDSLNVAAASAVAFYQLGTLCRKTEEFL